MYYMSYLESLARKNRANNRLTPQNKDIIDTISIFFVREKCQPSEKLVKLTSIPQICHQSIAKRSLYILL